MFSKVFVSLVRSGEQTGKLPEVLKSLTESLKWEDELAAQTKKLMMYPAFVGSIVLLVTFFLMIYLVPQMTGVHPQHGPGDPAADAHPDRGVGVLRRLLVGGASPRRSSLWCGAQVRGASATRRSQYAHRPLQAALPLIGPILRKIILSRFASSFAMMYASGITVLDAIRSCEEIVGNKPLENALRTAGQQIAEGKNMTAAFQDLGLFPPLVIRMLRIGENTGALDTALLNVSYFYNREVREAIGKAAGDDRAGADMVLGLILGWVMLSVLGPVYDSISKMKF